MIPKPILVRVEGIPAPQGSKRYVGNGRMIESSKKLKPWREKVRHDANVAAMEAGLWKPIAGPVALRLDFILPRPKYLKNKPTPPATKRPDWDKLSRAICDSLTDARIWVDDAQVVVAQVTKRIAEPGEEPGVEIRIEEIR